MPEVLFDRISSLTKAYINQVFPSYKLRLFCTLTVNILTTKKVQTSRTHVHIDVSININVCQCAIISWKNVPLIPQYLSPNGPSHPQGVRTPLQGHLPSARQWSAALSLCSIWASLLTCFVIVNHFLTLLCLGFPLQRGWQECLGLLQGSS